ncbi:GntR family transcriptional regulator [Actinosynnema sp. NPDC059797]
MDHQAARFIWQQVADDLAAEIDAGDLPSGSRLPSEAELAVIYGVARMTVRRAIADLAERDKVVRLHGRGTFVK